MGIEDKARTLIVVGRSVDWSDGWTRGGRAGGRVGRSFRPTDRLRVVQQICMEYAANIYKFKYEVHSTGEYIRIQ